MYEGPFSKNNHFPTDLNHFIKLWGEFWVDSVLLWGHFWLHMKLTLGPLWGHFGVTLGSLWAYRRRFACLMHIISPCVRSKRV